MQDQNKKEESVEVSQEDLDNFRKDNTVMNKAQVMEAVDKVFGEHIHHLKTRSAAEQTIVGNIITVLEGDLLKELKKIKSHLK
jgi:hypothetical protein